MKRSHAILSTLLTATLLMPLAEAAPPSSYDNPSTEWMRKAKTNIDAGNYAASIEVLNKTVSKDPGNADAYSLLGYSHRKLKQYEEAEHYYGKALSLDPEHVSALEYLGELYVETGRLADADRMLKRIDDACYFHCSEYDDLQAMIDRYRHGGV